jgi:hypothetical protein
MRETIITDDGKEYSVDEIVHSTRIQKSATPKGTIDWYLKWIASIWMLVAISMRSTGLPELQVYDMLLSFAGTALWAVVGFMWKDRAIIMINVVASIMLLGGLLTNVVGGG